MLLLMRRERDRELEMPNLFFFMVTATAAAAVKMAEAFETVDCGLPVYSDRDSDSCRTAGRFYSASDSGGWRTAESQNTIVFRFFKSAFEDDLFGCCTFNA